ncbi:MAG: hypothetical protein QW046_03855 [Candidatus Micrarchaeaceae archaeon]|uniref:hypothetical protein n=1 Tax=Sulfolobaceae TaxID=118883 RepID=UPI0031829FF3
MSNVVVNIPDLKKDYIEDLKTLKHKRDEAERQNEIYGQNEMIDLERDIDNIQRSINGNTKVARSVKETVLDASYVIENIYKDASGYGKALSEAYERYDVREMLINVIEEYANLTAMREIYNLITDHVAVVDEINIDDEMKFMKDRADRVKDVLISALLEAMNKEKQKELASVIWDKLLYYFEIEDESGRLIERLKDIQLELETDLDLPRGAYEVLNEAWNGMDENIRHALDTIDRIREKLGQEAYDEDETIDIEKLDFFGVFDDLVEIYNYFSVTQAYYNIICGDAYGICVRNFDYELNKAKENIKQIINIAIDYFTQS